MGTFLEFFAGCGLAAEGLEPHFRPIWANDICAKKRDAYALNRSVDDYRLCSIKSVSGSQVPEADLAWASFPCQDLSLAGKIGGIKASRSGMVWEWLRIMEEMKDRRPEIIVAENVLGLISANEGQHYRELHFALQDLGYHVGAMVLDAIHWVPQSRQRVFVVGTLGDPKSHLVGLPNWSHTRSLLRAVEKIDDFVWWRIPKPTDRKFGLSDLIDHEAPVDSQSLALEKLGLVPTNHKARLLEELMNGFKVAPGYRRMRGGLQCLELRFDDIAGCLRTPQGGSSRQTVILKKEGQLCTRLLTTREAARLMGVPDSFRLPKRYNDAYKAMGDGLVVPVVAHLANHLLCKLKGITWSSVSH